MDQTLEDISDFAARDNNWETTESICPMIDENGETTEVNLAQCIGVDNKRVTVTASFKALDVSHKLLFFCFLHEEFTD